MLLFIHRKDLRIEDLSAFDYIYSTNMPSLHLLILDPFLLKNKRHEAHSGINFLQHVTRLQELYIAAGKRLHVIYGEPAAVIDRTLQALAIQEIIYQQDFTPYAIHRDRKIKEIAAQYNVKLTTFIDHTLADLADYHRYSGRTEPYKVYTPFYRKWNEYLQSYYRPPSAVTLADLKTVELDAGILESFPLPFDLKAYTPAAEPYQVLQQFLEQQLPAYVQTRDQYAVEGTSSLSKSINLGAISIRSVYEALLLREHAAPWIRQLAWRDFYLYQSVYSKDFFTYEKLYDLTSLNDRHFTSWYKGETGIPVIDAAMTELNETGHMPNRLRMITAMFLTKNLLCPFTLGEQYFRYKLSDYDNTLNRGGWLWSSSMGFDAAPYFRIMNPVTQSQTHDPTGQYIRKWLPQLKTASEKEVHLPQKNAIVDLKTSRAAAIEVYKNILR
ncbi:cryptochrome/photolyase family protein [Paenibacillus eucommiae]|uniref:Deoxyribodipyrimidine photo-lyase n=1 Tax=Paenibacillus eucommiae TaxID=1355755 RepID=A0ABS4J547_9BACL|nr:deoxyribodipyrimidine photo-lyase [Paenibacillus eucommiae]MBP1994954.1 deoxyribodipyrimidine photo-lyase [Paenibacillus eucommiae]